MANPTLLMLDEPSEGLSIFVIQRIEKVCRHLSSQGIAIMLFEQNLDMAWALADRAYFLVNGKVSHHTAGETFKRKVSS